MKKNFTTKILKRAWLMGVAFVASIGMTQAQFTITENFKGSNLENGVILGGSPTAYLTSGIEDPINQGWLRITKAEKNQKGFAYINKSFPSTLGVFIDFEYKAWRDKADNTYEGADGFSIFLFDAQYGPNGGSDGNHEFALGGYGGSLGYANFYDGDNTTLGLSGGYLGIGIDEYGNFSTDADGRNGGNSSSDLEPNAVVLRGPTINDTTYRKGHMRVRPNDNSNYYLQGNQLSTDPTADEVDYNTVTNTRPTDNQFYRRIRIKVIPTNDGKYNVVVSWTKTPNGAFTELLNYNTTTPPPPNLKIGFAASTGGGFNYHEIRNLVVTTPGGVRVDKTVDKTSAAVGANLKYTINVYNATTANINNLKLADTLKDANGQIIPASKVRIDSVKFNNNGNSYTSIVSENNNGNIYRATLNMGAATSTSNTVATITAYATVLDYPVGGVVLNKVKLNSEYTGISDADTTNDVASATTQIVATDLSITASHNGISYQGDLDKSLVLNVSNLGPDATGSTTTVVDTLPIGLIYKSAAGNGWIVSSVNGQVVTAIYNGAINAGEAFPSLTIKVDVAADAPASVVNIATVNNSTDNIEANNIDKDPITILLFKPGVIANDQTIKEGTAPSVFTELTSPAMSIDGQYLYQWQISTDGVNWTNIDGATSDTYAYPTTLTETTYFRRLDNATGRSQSSISTNVIKITVTPSSLVVKLSAFSAVVKDDNTVLLQWTTASEQSSLGFEIEHSIDGSSWQKIGYRATKAVGGNSSSTIKYSYVDATPTVGKNYYRLKQIDKEGNHRYSEIKAVNCEGVTKVLLYPNPATTTIYVKTTNSVKSIQIISVSGQTVYQSNVVNQNKINVSGLAVGMYFAKMTMINGTIVKQKIIIRK